MPLHPESVAQSFLAHALNTSEAEVSGILHGQGHGHHAVGEAFVKELTQYAVDLQRVQVIKPGTDPHQFAEYLCQRIRLSRLWRPTGRAPLWGEGLLAATLWLLGGLFYSDGPTPGGAGRLARLGAGAIHPRRRLAAAGAELSLLAGARRVCCMPASGWRCCRCCSLGRADRQNCRAAGTILRAAAR